MDSITLNDKLSFVLGGPLFEDDDEMANLGLDKRLPVTKYWKHYHDDMKRLAQLVRAAEAYGLDSKIKEIIKGNLLSAYEKVQQGKALTYTQVLELLNALHLNNIDTAIKQRERKFRSKINFDDSTPEEVKQAYTALSNIKGNANASLQDLINPYNIEINAPFSLHTKNGVTQFTDKQDLSEKYKTLLALLQSEGWKDLIKELNAGYIYRSLVIGAVYPEMDDNQRRYTSMLYSLYTTLYLTQQRYIGDKRDKRKRDDEPEPEQNQGKDEGETPGVLKFGSFLDD